MANYDGSILINTKISVKSAEVQLSALENRMVKTADKSDRYYLWSISGRNEKTLFMGCDHDMTKDEVYAKITLNAILFSANLAAQVTVSNLCYMGIITEEQLAGWELKPCIQPVRSADKDESLADQEDSGTLKRKVLDFKNLAVKIYKE